MDMKDAARVTLVPQNAIISMHFIFSDNPPISTGDMLEYQVKTLIAYSFSIAAVIISLVDCKRMSKTTECSNLTVIKFILLLSQSKLVNN